MNYAMNYAEERKREAQAARHRGQRIAKTFFTRIESSSYGPRGTNANYTILDPATGIEWKVTRKHWVLPGSSWGYEANPMPGASSGPIPSGWWTRRKRTYFDTRYADNLEEMAGAFGYDTEAL